MSILKGPEGRAKVIELLKSGWELGGRHGAYGTRYWLQRRLGGGGVSFDIHAASFRALCRVGLVTHFKGGDDRDSYLTRYRLTPKGAA